MFVAPNDSSMSRLNESFSSLVHLISRLTQSRIGSEGAPIFHLFRSVS